MCPGNAVPAALSVAKWLVLRGCSAVTRSFAVPVPRGCYNAGPDPITPRGLAADPDDVEGGLPVGRVAADVLAQQGARVLLEGCELHRGARGRRWAGRYVCVQPPPCSHPPLARPTARLRCQQRHARHPLHPADRRWAGFKQKLACSLIGTTLDCTSPSADIPETTGQAMKIFYPNR
jgi:hypothetical protein